VREGASDSSTCGEVGTGNTQAEGTRTRHGRTGQLKGPKAHRASWKRTTWRPHAHIRVRERADMQEQSQSSVLSLLAGVRA